MREPKSTTKFIGLFVDVEEAYKSAKNRTPLWIDRYCAYNPSKLCGNWCSQFAVRASNQSCTVRICSGITYAFSLDEENNS